MKNTPQPQCTTCAVRHSAIWKAVPDRELPNYFKLFEVQNYPQNTVLADAGTPADDIFVLRSGHVRLHRIMGAGKRKIVDLG
jgi:CRP-like cAMP-binding protein